jgi:hypothetical protein
VFVLEKLWMIKFNSLVIVGILGTTFLAGCSESGSSSGDNRNLNPQTQSSQQNSTAQVAGWKPQDACAYLSHISGLQTRGYKNQYEDVFGCSSPYKELGVGSPLANNIAYYVGGSAQNANELKLVLNVNSVQSAKEAHAALLQYSDVLTQKALGVPMPEGAKSAILSGKAGKWTLGKAKVELVRENWATGKGYELKYILRKES